MRAYSVNNCVENKPGYQSDYKYYDVSFTILAREEYISFNNYVNIDEANSLPRKE